MFSALNQNSALHIITKTNNKIEYKLGRVESVTAPTISPYGGYNSSTVDINVSVDGGVQTFKNVPSALSVANFKNDGLIISETKEGLIPELDNIIQASQLAIDSYEDNKKIVSSGKEAMKIINSKYAKDVERDDTINYLKQDVANMKGDINKILTILTKREND